MLPTEVYYCHESEGVPVFDPQRGTKHHAPWWLILQCDSGIIDFYRWLMLKHGVPTLPNALWGAHVSVVKGEEPTNKSAWGGLSNKVRFRYSNDIRYTNDCHAWVNVWSPDLNEIRLALGLKPKEWFHMTLGRLKYGCKGKQQEAAVKYKLLYSEKCNEHELAAIKSFFRWHNVQVEFQCAGDVILGRTKGRMNPVLIDAEGDETRAVGFFGIIKHIENKGLLLGCY